MSETRRLAAIMAVDVVGFSRLVGEDEAGTARAVREHREAALPIVATSGGRIVKTMGDGLLLPDRRNRTLWTQGRGRREIATLCGARGRAV
jgi:class 3 adenylate cyclase